MTTKLFLAGLCGLAALTMTAAPAKAADADGAKLFKQRCAACHWDPAAAGEKPRVGPALSGVIGRKAGAGDFRRYSPAMKRSNVVWTAESLDHYLNDPRKLVKGTSMAFPGLKKPNERAAVVAYLVKHGK